MTLKCPKCESPLEVLTLWIESGEWFPDDACVECTNWKCDGRWNKFGEMA